MTEPNKESVRIALPSRPDPAPPVSTQDDTVRIVLPARMPTPVRRVPPKITPLLTSDPGSANSSAPNGPLPVASETQPASSARVGLKNETARITALPRPTPATTAQSAISSKPLDPFDLLPRPYCWSLFGIAAVIFLIQIWNYVVS